MDEERDELTLKEAGEILECSPDTVKRRMRAGRLPKGRLVKREGQRTRVVPRADVERLKRQEDGEAEPLDETMQVVQEDPMQVGQVVQDLPQGAPGHSGLPPGKPGQNAHDSPMQVVQVVQLLPYLHQRLALAEREAGTAEELRARLADRDGENEEQRIEIRELRDELHRMRQEHAAEIAELRREVEAAKLGAFVGLTQAVALRDAVRKLWH